MAKKQSGVKTPKKMKKIWCPLIAPKMFSNQILGKSNVYEVEQLIDKPVKVNLMTLSGDIKSQNINIGFKVLATKNGQGLTDIWTYELIPAHIKRLVRRRRDKIDDSFFLVTKDNMKLKIKPLIITLNKTSQAVRSDIRRTTKDSLARTFANFDFEDLMRNILMRKTQNFLKKDLNKIAPIRACEIRILQRLSDKQAEKAKVVVPSKEPKKPKFEKKEETPATKEE